MKRIILALATIASFAFQAEASQTQCVPTRTVAEARAEYENGLKSLDLVLAAEYAEADQILKGNYASSKALLDQRVKEVDAQYEQELAQIKEDLNPGWSQDLEAAAVRHNEALQAAKDEYKAQNDLAANAYHESTEESRLKYDRDAQALADVYNRSVCAQP